MKQSNKLYAINSKIFWPNIAPRTYSICQSTMYANIEIGKFLEHFAHISSVGALQESDWNWNEMIRSCEQLLRLEVRDEF